MAKRTIEFEDKTIRLLVFVIGAVFSAYFVLDAMFIDQTELQLDQQPQSVAIEEVQESQTTAINDLQEKMLMAESRRYAEVSEHYRRESQSRALTSAEKFRYNLVTRGQCRTDAIVEAGSEAELQMRLDQCSELQPDQELERQ